MLEELHISNFRIIESASLEFAEGLNILTGGNGEGKTSVLEAIYLLTHGRSFRHREPTPFVRYGAKNVLLRTRFRTQSHGVLHHLGLQRSLGELLIKLDGRPIRKRSEIFGLLPIQWIGPQPQDLITGSPEFRRKFLDRGLFHVEHSYLKLLQSYLRVLDQRNAALKLSSGDPRLWEVQLQELGTSLNESRQNYVHQLSERITQKLREWKLALSIEIRLQRGWPSGLTLAEALAAHREIDQKRQFTGTGPHRADLILTTQTLRSGKRLSRGQLKLLAVAFYFAQSELNYEARGSADLLLFDDPGAELDTQNKEKLLVDAHRIFTQSFLTALETTDLPVAKDTRMFHVEQGQLSLI